MSQGEAPQTRAQLIALQKQLCDKAREVMQAKNADYASTDDPFKNFRRRGRRGILTRLEDKFERLDTFCDRGKFDVDESLEDTVLDIINYAVLFLGYSEREECATSSRHLPCS